MVARRSRLGRHPQVETPRDGLSVSRRCGPRPLTVSLVHRLLAIPTLVLTLVSLGASPATAATASDRDPKNDVGTWDPDAQEFSFGAGYADLARFTVRHTSRRVFAEMRFHRLGAYAENDIDYTVPIQTDSDKATDYTIRYGSSDNPVEGVYVGSSSRKKQCGIRSRIDWSDDVVVFSAPRRCFRSPRRVRGFADIYVDTGSTVAFDYGDPTPWARRA